MTAAAPPPTLAEPSIEATGRTCPIDFETLPFEHSTGATDAIVRSSTNYGKGLVMPQMGHAEWLSAVAAEFETVLTDGIVPDGYSQALRMGLAQEGKILSAKPSGRWPFLVLASCEAVGGDWRTAVPVAASIEAFITSLDILDDFQDGDENSLIAALGQPRALNVSTGLLALSQQLLLRVRTRGLSSDRLARLIEDLTETSFAVGAGQDLDITLERAISISEAEALDVAGRKSAALVACACRLGAQVGTADPEPVKHLGCFGWNAGLAAQLANDLNDACFSLGQKSDLARGKKTVPLVIAAQYGIDVPWGSEAEQATAFRRALQESGVAHYTSMLIDIHCRRAEECLAEARGEGRGFDVLRTLLPLGAD